jgi:hypothetical protein
VFAGIVHLHPALRNFVGINQSLEGRGGWANLNSPISGIPA